MLLPTANRYPCGDGKWIVFNMPEPAWWQRFCRALGREEWITDERLKDARSRFRLMHELVPAIDETLSKKSRDEWGKIFDEAGLIWGPVLALQEVVDDAQAAAIGLFPELDDEHIGRYRTVNIPMRFRDADVGPRHRSPRPGEQTTQILKDSGLDDEAIKSLFERNIVA